MKFRAVVEPPEPMRGLELPPEVVASLGARKRPPVRITVNGHTWRSRVVTMRGRCLLGLSNANRQAAGVQTGEEIEVDVEIDHEPRVVALPADFLSALEADSVAHAAFERLPAGRKGQQVRLIEAAKRPETRRRRIATALAALRDTETPGRSARR